MLSNRLLDYYDLPGDSLNPFILGLTTRLKINIPVGREKIWPYISTANGLAEWFPLSCNGLVAQGERLQFGWISDQAVELEVLEMKPGKYVKMEWLGGSTVKYSLNGDDPVQFMLEVNYPDSPKSKETQLLEIASWSFYLANLKSVAQGGSELRNLDASTPWRNGFIDS